MLCLCAWLYTLAISDLVCSRAPTSKARLHAYKRSATLEFNHILYNLPRCGLWAPLS